MWFVPETALAEKGRENLEAANRLVDSRDDRPDETPLRDASASRAYYAVYQAIADRALRTGIPFNDSDQKYYVHHSLVDDVVRWRFLTSREAEELEWLQDLRVQADYELELVAQRDAVNAVSVARKLIHLIQGE